MLNEELLKIVVCPETKQKLKLSENDLVEKINSLIDEKKVKNRAGQEIAEKIDGGLIREDGKYLYPIREDIPVLLKEEAISLEEIGG